MSASENVVFIIVLHLTRSSAVDGAWSCLVGVSVGAVLGAKVVGAMLGVPVVVGDDGVGERVFVTLHMHAWTILHVRQETSALPPAVFDLRLL